MIKPPIIVDNVLPNWQSQGRGGIKFAQIILYIPTLGKDSSNPSQYPYPSDKSLNFINLKSSGQCGLLIQNHLLIAGTIPRDLTIITSRAHYTIARRAYHHFPWSNNLAPGHRSLITFTLSQTIVDFPIGVG